MTPEFAFGAGAFCELRLLPSHELRITLIDRGREKLDWLFAQQHLPPWQRTYPKRPSILLAELLEDFLGTGWEILSGDDVGALTSNEEILTYQPDIAEEAFAFAPRYIPTHDIFHSIYHQLRSILDDLVDDGYCDLSIIVIGDPVCME